MKIRFKTETGSVYEIDHDASTWQRISATPQSGPIRTDSGTFQIISEIKAGEAVRIIGPSLTIGAIGRLILTTPVVEIIPVGEKDERCVNHDIGC